ncbi:hypothetical protein ABIE67_005311 [Streptomyces sp. V4I8]|uniref:SCO3374 family protein n=1 Tax=Streptomyces sp. V4I8 TaxID=3156469 RepID=UPI003516FE88
MAGTRPAIITDSATIPLPRRPLDPRDQVRRWYENELGWPVVPGIPGSPLRLRVGPRFDVLDVPAEAGRAALRHLTPASPVAVQGDRMRLLMATGSAEEVPGVLDWLEWGALALDLTALGEGDLMEAPLPPEPGSVMAVRRPVGPVPRGGRTASRPAGALRNAAAPPGPLRFSTGGRRVAAAPRAWGRGRGLAADAVGLGGRWGRPRSRAGSGHGGNAVPPTVAATRVRPVVGLSVDQALAFSYASRMVAGTRPRSLTS